MFTAVVEKSDPWMLMVLPGRGSCWHAAFRAVRTVGRRVLACGLMFDIFFGGWSMRMAASVDG